ncbi:hypothetical protein [Anaerotignum sp. MB30-C6]|uniref:hypothetical protein n=1 Tax=Anaerotignum sp. MB30-C6 TaxID=3070814 RepID=UPI0027DD8AA4|nr:hypothetical protein [Anaerotignum sp. MB30-C6]WMI81276.1 hypothetical protein RBQ60_00665 [Anaerotignum sp. MB30-C6]
MERNMVYELAKTLQHTEGLEKDFLEMTTSLREAIEKNYIQKIQMAAGDQKAFAVEHPPKEVTLLRAIAPFLDENGRGQIQSITRSLLLMHTLQSVNNSVTHITEDGGLIAARSSDGSDGTTENLDPQSAKIAGLLMTLALVEKF